MTKGLELLGGPTFAYEDEYLFVVSKPPHLHTVQNPNSKSPSLAGWLLEQMPHLSTVSVRSGDAGLIQRLDFSTGGLIMGAKSSTAWKDLRALLKSGGLQKTYLALVEGELATPKEIMSYLGSPYRRSQRVRVFDKPTKRALKASTTLTPLDYSSILNATLVKVRAPEGRRHQVRAHSAFLGHPLVGDALYGSNRLLTNIEGLSNVQQFFLWASALEFMHPVSRERILVEVTLPGWIHDYFSVLGNQYNRRRFTFF